MDLVCTFYPAKLLPQWMAKGHEYGNCKEDKYSVVKKKKKKIAQPKENNDREETHKVFL